nr:pilus assembly protein [Lachnospiraceae bacterium]
MFANQRNKGDIACPLFWERGSLTVEAALILPLFLSVIMIILSFLDVMETAIEHRIRQQNLLRNGAVTAHMFSDTISGREGDCIRMDLLYPVALSIGGFRYRQVLIRQKGLVHIFNGYDDSGGDRIGETEEFVYITEYGRVYHRKRTCQGLNISVKEVAGHSVFSQRNADRKIYRGCNVCGEGYSKKDIQSRTLYITDYGIRYHVSLNCPDLSRTLQVVKISRVGGRTPCKLCGGLSGS